MSDTPFRGPVYAFEYIYFQAGRFLFSEHLSSSAGQSGWSPLVKAKAGWLSVGLVLIALVAATNQVHASCTEVSRGLEHISMNFGVGLPFRRSPTGSSYANIRMHIRIGIDRQADQNRQSLRKKVLMPYVSARESTGKAAISTTTVTTRRSVLVTGASTGIGNATVLRLAQKGWRVFAAVRKKADANALDARELKNIETVLLDVSDRRSIQSAALEIKARLETRGLDGLFNNAGIGTIAPVENLSSDELRRVFEVNLFGQIDVIQAFLPLVRQARGRIINTGSVGDHLTPPFAGALASSKAAFASITAALRLELRPQGIHVCLIEPGSVNTPAVEKTLGGVDKAISGWPPDSKVLYADALRQMANAFAKSERGGSTPEDVAEVVERALTARNPATRYPAGKDSMKLAMLAWLLPEKLLDLAVLRYFGLSTAFGKSSI